MNGRRHLTALVLACGLALSVILLTAGVLYDAIASKGPGLSDNATQVLTTAFGGIIGVLGTYLGATINGTKGEAMTTTPEEPSGDVAQPDDTGSGDVAQPEPGLPDSPGEVAEPGPDAEQDVPAPGPDSYDDASPNDEANE